MEASYSISVDENEVATKIEELDTPMEENLKDEIKHEEGSTLDLENEGENDAGGTMVNNDSGLQKFNDKLLEEDTSEETKENEGNEYADSVEGEEKNEQESDKETNEDGPKDGQFPNEVITCEDDVLQ